MSKENKSQKVRQIIMVAVLLLVLGGFLLDKYVLWPSHMEKIDKVVNEVTLKLSSENRQQVHDIIGFAPNSTFTHAGIEVEQYRFARGIPGFKRPILDIAFEGDTIAYFRQDSPIDEAYIESQRSIEAIDSSKTTPIVELGEGSIMGLDGRPLNTTPKKQETPEEADDSEDTDETDDN